MQVVLLTAMLYLLLLWAGTGLGRCRGATGLAKPGGVFLPLLPLEELVPLSLEMVRLDKEWLKVVGAVEEEFKVEVDLVVGAVPLDLLSSEALS